jgi:hypothetical protein
MVFGNAHLDSLVISQSGGSVPVIGFSGLTNAANNRMGVTHSTLRNGSGEFGIYTVNNTSASQLEFNQNSFWDGASATAFGPHIAVQQATTYFDVSANRVNDSHPLSNCAIQAAAYVGRQDIQNATITNNFVNSDTFLGGDQSGACNWRNTLIQQNRVQCSSATAPGYQFSFWGFSNFSAPGVDSNIWRGNYSYGCFRGMQISGSNEHVTGNTYAWIQHHFFVFNAQWSASPVGGATGRVYSDELDHNLEVSFGDQGLACLNIGYDDTTLVDAAKYHHNTCLSVGSGGSGPVMLGDSDWGVHLIAGLMAYDNILVPGTNSGNSAFSKYAGLSFAQSSLTLASNNAMQAVSPHNYLGITSNPASIPNPSYNRNARATIGPGGANYNASVSRNITGVTVQNPNFNGELTIALKYNWTSGSNITMQMSSDGGSTYGTAVQLNWAGSGVSYTLSTITDPGLFFDYLTLTTSASSFTASGIYGSNPFPAGCPVARWMLTTSAGVNQWTAEGIMICPGTLNASTAQLQVVPRITGFVGSETISVINSEIHVCDASTVHCVDIGIDARSIPHTTVSPDTGIVVSPSDYCNTDCQTQQIAFGLPTTFTSGVTNSPLAPLVLPELGGSSEAAHCAGQSVCGGTSTYVPTIQSGWQFGSTTGSYIGAVPPNPAATAPNGILP